MMKKKLSNSGDRLSMKNSKMLDQGEAFPGIFSEDLLMMIMAFLPIECLLRFRTVSKWWNAVLKDPHFHKIRPSLCQEFVTNVMEYAKSYMWVGMVSSRGGLLLMHDLSGKRPYTCIMRPKIVSFREIPRLVCSLQPGRLNIDVRDMVVDEKTKEYIVFAVSYFTPALKRRGRVPEPEEEELEARGEQADLHCYDYATDVWTLWGKEGLNLKPHGPDIDAIVTHRGRYTFLTCWRSEQHVEYTVFFYNEFCRWEVLPGRFPYAMYQQPISFFDHRGALHVAVVHGGVFALWVYRDEALKWALIWTHDCGLEEYNRWHGPFGHVSGDFLHFGIYAPKMFTSEMEEANSSVELFSRRMIYNLVTGKLEDVSEKLIGDSRDRSDVMVIRQPGFTKTMLLHPE